MGIGDFLTLDKLTKSIICITMDLENLKLGDLVGLRIPSEDVKCLKTGIVIRNTETNVVIKWISYDKDYFMEKEGNIFTELNKTYLLSEQAYHRLNKGTGLHLLSSS